ncbi:MAG: sigma-70 family RNA polymerase sigma factor [Vicinamibacterales bacterium]
MERFPLTHQSVLERIRSGNVTVRHGAFGDLVAGYWRPSYHYLRLHWRLSADEAEDIIQGFFTAAFEKAYLEKFDPAKARFRTFLRTCLDRFLQNQRKAETTMKRGGAAQTLSLDFPGAEQELALVSTDLRDLDRFFRDETIRALFARAVDKLRKVLTREGKARAFEAFERHDLSDADGRSYASVANAMGVPVTTVTNDLHTARTRFREIALLQLRSLVGTDEEFRQEARQLFGVEVSLDVKNEVSLDVKPEVSLDVKPEV